MNSTGLYYNKERKLQIIILILTIKEDLNKMINNIKLAKFPRVGLDLSITHGMTVSSRNFAFNVLSLSINIETMFINMERKLFLVIIMDKIVTFDKVLKKFQLFWEEILVFDKISLEINRDELVLFYGPSGSGKTTLLNLITGLIQPDGGEIQVAGLYIDLIPNREKADFRSQYLGIVFQENNLVSTLTVEENIILFQELCEIRKEDGKGHIEDLLKKLGIYERKGSFPTQLSGGEKKRAAIARALSANPYILVLDEPTGNLDIESAKKICNLIQEIFTSTDITIIIAAHDPKMKEIASSIYKVEGGKVKLEYSFPERKKKNIEYRSIDSIERAKEDMFFENTNSLLETKEEAGKI
ncbi:MAG: ABC transporter ATP-binding protein [Candidatus Heimdallarchaeaceae archaeon]